MFRSQFPRIIALLAFALAVSAQPEKSGEVSLTRCWSYAVNGGIDLATDNVTSFVALTGGRIEAISTDGKRLWASELGGEISSNILTSESSAFVVTGSTLRALSRATGITSWTAKLPSSTQYFLTTFNGAIVLVSREGAVLAFEAASGSPRWEHDVGSKVTVEPMVRVGRLAVVTNDKEIISSAEMSDGLFLIPPEQKMAHRVTSWAEGANDHSFTGDERGTIAAFTNHSQKPAWKFKSGGQISKLVIAGDTVLAASHDNFVYALSARNGDVRWKKRLSGRVSDLALMADRYAVLTGSGDDSGMLVELEKGRTVAQIPLESGETMVRSRSSTTGSLNVLTDRALSAYSLTACPAK